jgi:hypothetical protein
MSEGLGWFQAVRWGSDHDDRRRDWGYRSRAQRPDRVRSSGVKRPGEAARRLDVSRQAAVTRRSSTP